MPTGERPVGLAYSPLSDTVYVAHDDGAIVGVDARNHTVVARLAAQPGLAGCA